MMSLILWTRKLKHRTSGPLSQEGTYTWGRAGVSMLVFFLGSPASWASNSSFLDNADSPSSPNTVHSAINISSVFSNPPAPHPHSPFSQTLPR